MGENKNWNDDFTLTSMRRKRDPLHQFSDDVFYTQEITNGIMASIERQPLKADRYGYYHSTSM